MPSTLQENPSLNILTLPFKPLPSTLKQSLLLEFASLKYVYPEGIFVTITPNNISLWNGILFVRSGPYASAILRFQISFPPQFPMQAPLITFSSDIFHPLLTPLTTYTYTTSAADEEDTVSASDLERLPPGGFTLRHGFPGWFRSPRSLNKAKEVKSVAEISVYDVLEYLRYAFNDEACLDAIPLHVAANRGAIHAWNNFRARQANRAASPNSNPASSKRSSGIEHLSAGSGDAGAGTSRGRRPGEWNWNGVWEDRVRRGVQASMAEQTLFGSTGLEEMIRFSALDSESYDVLVGEIEKRQVEAP
jgi:hypothetical protein